MPSNTLTQESNSPHASDLSKIKDVAIREKIEKAIVSLNLEGMTLSKDSLEDLVAFANGEISRQESLIRVINRAKSSAK